MNHSLLWPSLLRAGAYGALHGGHAGEPQVGLTVPIQMPDELGTVLGVLAEQDVKATLLISPDTATAELWQATQAGHEVGGLNLNLNFPLLEALSAQPVRVWGLPDRGFTRGTLARLQKVGIAPLPQLDMALAPGAILRVAPQDLADELERLRQLGYQAVPVRELIDLRRASARDLFNHTYQRLLEDPYAQREGMIDLSERYDAVFRVAPLDHAPAPLPLPRDTPTAELHVNSARVVGLTSRHVMTTYKAFRRSLKDVAHALQTHPELQDAQAVFAVTLFHSVLEKSGFHPIDLPIWQARWYGLGFRLLRVAYGTTRTPSEDLPRMCWMTREEFLKRYG